MIFENSNPVPIKIENGRKYLALANGGDVTIERMLDDGSFVPVDGSPLVDADERFFTTHSHDENIYVSSSAGVIFNLASVK
jgi:hypothetical protein